MTKPLVSLCTDLRFIIGLFFSLCAIILVLASCLGESDLVEGIRINLWSGIIMGGFGGFMIALSIFRQPKD